MKSYWKISQIEKRGISWPFRLNLQASKKITQLAFTLKTINGLSTEEVCKELEINPSNLWVIINRARKLFSMDLPEITNCLKYEDL